MHTKTRYRPFLMAFALACSMSFYAYLHADSYIVRYFDGVGGAPHTMGVFSSTDGNPGIIEFNLSPTNSGTYPGAALISYESGQTLSGYFWIGTIGWVSLENVDFTQLGPSPASIDTYYLSGWAWSDYAGWIDLSETGHVTWEPVTGSFSGYAWNDNIGWIDMLGGYLENTSSGLIGKVKIIGNAGSNLFFDTTYSIRDLSVQGKMMNPIINAVRKNVAIILRNLPADKMNSDFSTTLPNTYERTIIFSNTGTSPSYVSYANQGIHEAFDDVANPTESLIVVGGDIYIDQNVIASGASWDHPKAIIALKNMEGIGGNIFIKGDVTKIHGALVAEGSLFSGYYTGSSSSAILYNGSSSGLLLLPRSQLYIYGSIISHNTIGGAYGQGVGTYVCPFVEKGCTKSIAIRYDFNYFRDFQKNIPNIASLRGYKNSVYDDYSMVIEYDTRVQGMPPPGLETLK